MLNNPMVLKTIQQVASSIASILNVEIMIMDNRFNKLGGTVNREKDFYISNIYKYIMRTGKRMIIENPGFHPLCKGCKNYRRCPEKAEFDFPIKLDNEIIGILSLVGYTEEHREIMLSRKDDYINFLEIMCQMISTKVSEVEVTEKLRISAMQMSYIFNSITDGIIAFNEDGIITHFSNAAEKIFNISQENIIGNRIDSIFPNFKLDNNNLDNNVKKEMKAIMGDGKEFTCYISSNILKDNEGQIKGGILTVSDVKNVKKIVRDMMGYDNKYVDFNDIIGCSELINDCKQKAEIAAKGVSTIMIRGESGTGKELFARAIHNLSPMSNGPFITINCSAIPETLLESELFGYEEGAFTGAKKEGKPGKFELADGGTIFLDEIGDMPLHLQAKLLRVLQDKVVQRIGGVNDIKVNVRVISATNRNLEKMVSENKFREDLYYRLNVIPIFIPPLRDRKEDIPLLTEYLINKYSSIFNKNIKGLDDRVKQIFMSYNWPGNVRELENVIEYAMNMEKTNMITEESIPKNILDNSVDINNKKTLKQLVEDYEKKIIMEHAKKYGFSKKDKENFAKELGISIATLYRKLRTYNIEL